MPRPIGEPRSCRTEANVLVSNPDMLKRAICNIFVRMSISIQGSRLLADSVEFLTYILQLQTPSRRHAVALHDDVSFLLASASAMQKHLCDMHKGKNLKTDHIRARVLQQFRPCIARKTNGPPLKPQVSNPTCSSTRYPRPQPWTRSPLPEPSTVRYVVATSPQACVLDKKFLDVSAKAGPAATVSAF